MENTELDVVLERLNNLIESNKLSHDAILQQVIKTNGKVAENTKWRHLLAGGLIVSNAIIVPIIIAIVLKVL